MFKNNRDAFSVAPTSVPEGFPPGHFYSPIVDPSEITARENEMWPAIPRSILGIDFNDLLHRELLSQDFPKYIGDYDYPECEADVKNDFDFFTQNSQFSWLDSRTAFVLLRKWRPKHIIEVGSGFSSLLLADVNRRFLDAACRDTCIEPYPRPFLFSNILGITEVIEKKCKMSL